MIAVVCSRVSQKNRFLQYAPYPDFSGQQLPHGQVSIFGIGFHKNPHLTVQRPLCRKHGADSLFLSAYAVRFYGALQNQLFPRQSLPVFLHFYLSVRGHEPAYKYDKRKQHAGQTVYVVPVRQRCFAAPSDLHQAVQHACCENRRE